MTEKIGVHKQRCDDASPVHRSGARAQSWHLHWVAEYAHILQFHDSTMRGLIPGLINRENGTTCQSRTFEHGAGDSCGLWQRMALDSLLVGHRGCVNHVEFNEQGSEDTHLRRLAATGQPAC